MDIRILNRDFKWEHTIDRYNSFIWAERYRSAGDFEIKIPMDEEILSKVKLDYYVEIDNSDRNMIVETLRTTTDPEEGDFLYISGRSLESILSRRVDGSPFINYTDTLLSLTSKFLNRGFQNYSGQAARRVIPNFTFRPVADYSDVFKAKYNVKKNMVQPGVRTEEEIIQDILNFPEFQEIGYKITLTELENFFFEYYVGTDRSYNQKENPWVIFSSDFGNLHGSEFILSNENYKNQALMTTSNSNYVNNGYTSSHVVWAYNPSTELTVSGLDLREYSISLDGELNLNNGDSWANFDSSAKNLGRMQIGRRKIVEDFTGEGVNTPQYIYKRDYFLGDVVQIEDRYGNSAPARISEYIFSDDEQNGVSAYPTFSVI